MSLFHPASAQPVLRVVLFVERADYDSPAGAGMDEFAFFEINAHVCHPLSGGTAGEENQVSLTQVVAGDPVTFFELAVSVPGQTDVIYAHVELRYQTGTVRAVLTVATCAIGNPKPFRRSDVQLVVILLVDVHSHADGGFGQCLVVEAWGRGAAGTETSDQSDKGNYV